MLGMRVSFSTTQRAIKELLHLHTLYEYTLRYIWYDNVRQFHFQLAEIAEKRAESQEMIHR